MTVSISDSGISFADGSLQPTALTTGTQTIAGAKTFSSPVTMGSAQMPTPSGSAPLYGCRAWANLTANGASNPTLNASGNIASVTRSSTGLYAVTFTTAMPDANYAVTVTNGQLGVVAIAINLATSGFTFESYNSSAQVATDMNSTVPFSFAVFR